MGGDGAELAWLDSMFACCSPRQDFARCCSGEADCAACTAALLSGLRHRLLRLAQRIVGRKVVDCGEERIHFGLIGVGVVFVDRLLGLSYLGGVLDARTSMSWGTLRYSRTCCATSAKTGAETAVP